MASRKKSPSLKLSAAVERFLLSLATDNKSPYTLTHYRQKLRVMLQLLETRCTDDEGRPFPITGLKQVTVDVLRQVSYILQHEPVGMLQSGKEKKPIQLSASSAGAYILVLKSFFSWCYQEGLISSNPADVRLKMPKVPKKVKSTFTTEHVQKMLAACDLSTDLGYRDLAVLLLFFDTGLRRAEVASLTLDNVHEDYVKVLGKGRKERQIGIHPDTSLVLWKYIEMHRAPNNVDEPHVFIGMYGEPLSGVGVYEVVKRIQVKAGLENILVHPHLFRHTFAQFYMENGGDILGLSRELGHEDISTTEKYLSNFTSAQAREKHTRFSPVSLIEVKGVSGRRKRKS